MQLKKFKVGQKVLINPKNKDPDYLGLFEEGLSASAEVVDVDNTRYEYGNGAHGCTGQTFAVQLKFTETQDVQWRWAEDCELDTASMIVDYLLNGRGDAEEVIKFYCGS